VAFQLALGLARIAGAADPSGIHYASPYPALQEPPLKKVLRWDVEPLVAHLAGAHQVFIAQMNPWSAHWLMCFLYSRGVDFFLLGPVKTNFGAGEQLGQMAPPWKGDAMISLSRSPLGYAVQYADGRPSALVAWPEAVR
jgi:hypothetical protein